MYHGLNNDFLYSAFKLNVDFINSKTNYSITLQGTGFFC